MENSDKANLRAYREKNFHVRVEPIDHRFLYEDELVVAVTHNGSQYTSFALTPKEARKVINAIKEYLEK